MLQITLASGAVFDDPESRIREYCEIEVYRDRNYRGGYDDHLNVTDSVTAEDVEAANNLRAGLSSLDRGRITHSREIPEKLARINDVDLGGLTDGEWADVKAKVREVLSAFLSIPNVKLPATFKILHLKRPHLFPVLDSYVVKFLTGNDMDRNPFSMDEQLQIGLTSMDIARSDLVKNGHEFVGMQPRLADLPTALTPVRMYDILCWTQEKWVDRGETAAPYGVAEPFVRTVTPSTTSPQGAGSDSASKEPPTGEIRNIKEFRRIKLRAEGVVVNTGSKPPRAHRPLCRELTEERFQEAAVFNEGKGGKYCLRNDLAEAVRDFGAVACLKCRPERPIVRRD
jgi:hypothetical protein